MSFDTEERTEIDGERERQREGEKGGSGKSCSLQIGQREMWECGEDTWKEVVKIIYIKQILIIIGKYFDN